MFCTFDDIMSKKDSVEYMGHNDNENLQNTEDNKFEVSIWKTQGIKTSIGQRIIVPVLCLFETYAGVMESNPNCHT